METDALKACKAPRVVDRESEALVQAGTRPTRISYGWAIRHHGKRSKLPGAE